MLTQFIQQKIFEIRGQKQNIPFLEVLAPAHLEVKDKDDSPESSVICLFLKMSLNILLEP